MHESKMIANAIYFLENGKIRERKKAWTKVTSGKHVFYDDGIPLNRGYSIKRDMWCWLIWKHTDISKNPEYDGSPLLKIVPMYCEDNKEAMAQILDAQRWIYL